MSDDEEIPTLIEIEAGTSADERPVNTGRPAQLQDQGQPVVEDDLPPCPVTILSGFLGSGKTTLIQYILKSPDHKKRIAVIENEFGEGLAIESLIAKNGVDEQSLTDLIELPNGCVCCTVKDSLVETLEGLISKRRDLDYIIIEASGMANPGPIASVFWLDDELESRLRLDGVVTLVDSYHITRQLQETLEASQQIAYADRILLNKTDLVEAADCEEVKERLFAINPAAQIQTTTYSQVPDLNWILDAKCYSQGDRKAKEFSKSVDNVVAKLGTFNEKDNHHEHNHTHEHDHASCAQCIQQQNEQSEHTHTGAVSTLAFTEIGTMDLEKVNTWLASTLWPNQDEKDEVLRTRLEQQLKDAATNSDVAVDGKAKRRLGGENKSASNEAQIFRIKGVLSIKCHRSKLDEAEWGNFCESTTGIDRRRYIIQAVYDLWDIQPSFELFHDYEQRDCKLVIIGRHLNRRELLKGFQSCLIAS